MKEAIELTITGIVQGVGFRPFIYRIAVANGLAGQVKNIGGSAVSVVVEGEKDDLQRFLNQVTELKPPAAFIESIQRKTVPPTGRGRFEILESDAASHSPSMIPADIAICNDCLAEVLDPTSRWHKYAFNSCAVCGPRFSVIEDIPYDRKNTSMADFELCPSCTAEYGDPSDIRRFHVQGISCPHCGPSVWLEDNRGLKVKAKARDPIEEAGRLLSRGKIIGVKGLGGFHIAASASDDAVVSLLRRRKDRPEKPFAVMALNLRVASRLAVISSAARTLLTSRERPIVLVDIKGGGPLSGGVAPGLKQLGLFLPYTALHHLLLMAFPEHFAIMTSGNPAGEPMCIDEKCAKEKLSNCVDYFLMHDRRIINRVDDSVVRFTLGRPTLLRRGRGYAPKWIDLPRRLSRPAICFGAMLQNAGAVAFGNKAVLTQYIGDTDEYFTSLELERYLRLLSKNYRVDPHEANVVCDLHPSYPSTAMAREWSRQHDASLIEVQHHWAHIASVMAEKGLEGEILGIAVDGTGYGADGNIWGGEVLRSSFRTFTRLGHLSYQPLPGGDLASTYPSRMLAAILSGFLEDDEVKKVFRSRGLTRGLPRGEKELEVVLLQCKTKAVMTSSLGRVFDAASALLGVCMSRTYEGEPAIKLEASSVEGKCLLEPAIRQEEVPVLDTAALFGEILALMDERPASELAYAAQYSLGRGLASIALTKAKRGDTTLAVSGGAAVNSPFMKGVRDSVGDRLQVVTNDLVPPGDGGIALGQAALADSRN